MDESSIAGAISSLFKDGYASLEQIQEHAAHIEPFSDAIVTCHWAIQNLERIHRAYAKDPHSTLAQDAFSLRNNLERFIASCHALIRMVDPLNTATQVGCFMGGGKAALKRKQVRELQEEFWDHQRILSLVLANAVYMTTLDMQKESSVPDPELEHILRQSQKRHTVYEKADRSGQEHKSQKPSETHVEQLEWEVCLRKYFDYVEKQSKRFETALRRQSEPMLAHNGSLVRHRSSMQSDMTQDWAQDYRYSLPSGRKLLTYGTSMENHSYNEIYTRPRRNSTASRASSVDARSRNNSMSSMQSAQTVVTAPTSAHPSPIMSPQQWDHSSASNPVRHSSPPVPNTPAEETITRAWKDIVSATQTMSLLEARAYIEGRLAGLDPNTIAEIRRAMNPALTDSPIMSPTTPVEMGVPQTMFGQAPTQMFERGQQKQRPRSVGAKPALTTTQSMPLIKAAPLVAPPARAMSEPTRAKKSKVPGLHRPVSQKRLSSLRNEHARQLSTIVERPSTAKSRGESIKSRKSMFSLKKEKPPPLPEKPKMVNVDRKPSAGSAFSSDASTLRGSTPEEKRLVELEEVPEEPGPLPVIKNTKTTKRSLNSALASKPLPMTPGELIEPSQSEQPVSSVKSKISRLLSPLSRRSLTSIPSTKSTPSLATIGAGMKSHETLSHMSNASLECLRKGGMNGSRSTLLVAYQDSPDQPFQVWLNALPYIEGRAGTRV